MDPRFWGNRREWPYDFEENIFLGRALEEVGKSTFSSEWTEHDTSISTQSVLDFTPNHRQNKEALWYLSRTKPDVVDKWETFKAVPRISPGGTRLLPFDLWTEARENQKKFIDLELPKFFARRDAATQALKSILLSGSVVTRTRIITGGRFIDCDPGFWDRENFEAALHRCCVGQSWIFLDRMTFDRARETRAGAVQPPLSSAEATVLLTREFQENGSLSQRRAEELILKRGGWKREAVRALHLQVTGEAKPGPKRPRRLP